jgi:hypothetical protein
MGEYEQWARDPRPALLSEREAATLLRVKRVKTVTVRAERIRSTSGDRHVGARIFYTHQQIADYLERQSVPACANNATNASDKLATIGSARSLAWGARMRGAALATMTASAKRAASALAQHPPRGMDRRKPENAQGRARPSPDRNHPSKLSGRIEARTGLRMMPTSPRSSLSFRAAGFPQHGWKAGCRAGPARGVVGLSLLPAYTIQHPVCVRLSCTSWSAR